ncbi:MAG: MIP family channel protein [Bacteroidales bacterium]|nr:MIP family channel protein [Bacteroidales bacterium]MDD3201859.1 MIP family channel protein [Bacteroidales bacterium]
MKKYFSEAIGTMVLVLLGCGSAIFNGGCGTTAQVLTVAFAFGLSVVAMAYAIGSISGCHINPAITLGCMLTGRMKSSEGLKYMLAQVIGAFVGSAILYALVHTGTQNVAAYATTTGANAVGAGASVVSALIAECVGTFIFVLVVLGVTDSKKGNPSLAGLAIGLTLVLIHIVLIPITGTSVNPARSIAPAVFEGGKALSQLWIFIVAPFVGAALSALVWNVLSKGKEA